MAIDDGMRSCTIVLHDGRVSEEGVLCGAAILPIGGLGYLSATGSRHLYVKCKTQTPNASEVSIHVSLAQRFGFENRTKATLKVVEDDETATATHVELFFRDQHLSRADMWRLVQSFDDTALFQGQVLKYLGSDAAKVETIYVSGQNVDSAYVSYPRTKAIFRSGSARYTILIQLSKAMLEYWIGGDLMYERLLSGFLPELFQRWESLKLRHQVSIVLFGRSIVESEGDFYHVLASDESSTQWPEILKKLRRAFNDPRLPRQISLAAQGSMVEAIHLAAMDFADEDVDPYLNTTGTSIIAITANTGLFQTNHGMLKCTTNLLMGNGIGVDIVSLSPKPLHPIPLFSYEKDGASQYALPHWVDVSYWEDVDTQFTTRWLLADTYEDSNDVAIGRLQMTVPISASALMNGYDDGAFQELATSPSRASGPAPSTSVSSDGTVKAVENKAGIKPSTPRRPIKIETNAQAKGSLRRLKRETAPPSPVVQIGRKISLGPKGLAPGRSTASTTLSVEHAGLGREASSGGAFIPNEASSGLAQQIRQTLNRKHSQQSLGSQSSTDQTVISQPISILSYQELKEGEVRKSSDCAGVLGRAVLDTVTEVSFSNGSGTSPTPRAKQYAFFGAVAVETDDHWTMSPWVTLLNPCNPKRDNMIVASQFRKWQHVFPRALSLGAFKWASMCSPAALPLTTEYYPTHRQLEKHAAKKLRRILIPSTAGTNHDRAHSILEQLIALRLTHGFQLPTAALKAMSNFNFENDEPVLMSLGSVHHELQCLSGAEIQIIEYTPNSAPDCPDGIDDTPNIKYNLRIRGPGARKTINTSVEFSTDHSKLDWTILDDQVTSQENPSMEDGGARMRLVLIPVEQPRSTHITSRELSDEEKRIDGIQRLTQMWQRNRYFSEEEQRHQASIAKAKVPTGSADRDPNPLAIEYQTRDPSAVVNAYGPTLTGQFDEYMHLFVESDLFHTTNFDTAKLTRQMQQSPPNGVEVRDRRWFTRMHLKCFRGDEMVNWLLRVFKDLHTRDDAIRIGNELMLRGIFAHVRHKHEFRDGNYFYQISSAHRLFDYPDTASMFGKALRSIPVTPATETRNSPMLRPLHEGSSNSSGREKTPKLHPTDKKQILLSQSMQCNVDPGKKSDHLEIVTLHYDRVHNPENCYHIQLDWTNTTSKLIRESIGRWSGMAEIYGLKLVQLPLTEACKLQKQHPFDQLIPVKLAVRPPDKIMPAEKVPATPQLAPHSLVPKTTEDPLIYQKLILRSLDFVLDFEAAASFMTKLDVSYSWGRPNYELTQFVHRSGLMLAQVSADERSDFLLLPNRLASRKPSNLNKATEIETIDSIVNKVKTFCKDAKALKAFYDEAKRPQMVAPSPAVGASLADSDVPPMELPPHVGHRAALKGL
ncbi:vacuolar membrane-associated protein iml1 [Acrodontium crateriforme]|uniref:Vacuolar membrane-associated protein IML1 n=1 Tax=Acrodontium crateriforme TaxID=150365 RepID=A0AAQ3RE90_9PEZI|nr:vacuolar membrane-associated protein iml1 [Acrodontium crateriforme]